MAERVQFFLEPSYCFGRFIFPVSGTTYSVAGVNE